GAVIRHVEPGLAVGEVEPSGTLRDGVVAARLEQPWGARVIGCRLAGLRIVAVARPEHTHLRVDLLVRDPRVVGDAPFARDPQLLEDLAWAREREAMRPVQGDGEILDDPPV